MTSKIKNDIQKNNIKITSSLWRYNFFLLSHFIFHNTVTKNFFNESNKFNGFFCRGTVKRLIDEIVGWQTRCKNQGKRITRRCRFPVPEEKWISSVAGAPSSVKMTLIIGFSFNRAFPQNKITINHEDDAVSGRPFFFPL